MGSSLTYNSLGSTSPFPVSLLYELLARSKIFESLASHTISLLQRKLWEVAKFWFIFSLNGFVYSFLFSFSCFCKWFSLKKKTLIFDHVFIESCSCSCLTKFFLPLCVEETEFTAHLHSWMQRVFCCLVVAVKWKKKFQKCWLTELSYLSFISEMLADFCLLLILSTPWPSSIAQLLQPITHEGLSRS